MELPCPPPDLLCPLPELLEPELLEPELLDFLVLPGLVAVCLVPLLPLALPRAGELGLVFAVAVGAPSALGASWAAATPGEVLGLGAVLGVLGLDGAAGWTFAGASGAGRAGAAPAS